MSLESKTSKYLWKVFPGKAISECWKAHDGHLHVVRVQVPLVYGDPLECLLAHDINLRKEKCLSEHEGSLLGLTEPPMGVLYSSA